MRWDVTTPPAVPLLTWQEAKAHLRIDSDADQPAVEQMIAAATDEAADLMESSLVEQTITATFYECGRWLTLPRGPLIEIESVTDAGGADLLGETKASRVGRKDAIAVGVSYTVPLTVVYRAGYATPSDVPAAIRQTILCHVGHLYENREGSAGLPASVAAFYARRRRGLGIG